jgi:hypothetical protein
MGIVRWEGECTLLQQSWGTQYSMPPSESLSQPPMLGFAQNQGWIGSQEEGRKDHMKMILVGKLKFITYWNNILAPRKYKLLALSRVDHE